MQRKVISYKYYLSSDFDAVEREDGDILYISTGISTKKRYTKEKLAGEYLSEGEIVCIPWGGTPNVKYHKGKFVTGDNRIATSFDTNILNNKYLYYWMQSQIKTIESFYRGAGLQHPSMKSVLEMLVPVPPIAAQEEIVRILDEYSEKNDRLIDALNAELEARKVQYEFYREKLFSFESQRYTVLENIADIGTGSSNTNEATEDGEYPFFVRSPVVLKKGNYEFDETAIITAGDGVGVGKVFHFVSGKYALHQRAYRICITDTRVLPKFFFYYMKATFYPYINAAKYEGSVSSIRRPMLNAYPVPILDEEKQERIVFMCEQLETCYSNLFDAMTKEIQLRQAQYEYYRDKLLSFKEAT